MNEHHENEGEAPPGAPVDPTDADLIALARSRKIRELGRDQIKTWIPSLAFEYGPRALREFLEAWKGGDILDLAKAMKSRPKARDKPRNPPAQRCGNPRCLDGMVQDRVVDDGKGGVTLFKPCPGCAALQTSA